MLNEKPTTHKKPANTIIFREIVLHLQRNKQLKINLLNKY